MSAYYKARQKMLNFLQFVIFLMEVERLHLMCSHGEKMSMSKITETGKPARAKGVDVSARPPNLSSASCNFDVLSPDPPKIVPFPHGPLVSIGIKIWCIRFQNSVFTSLVTDRRTNGKTT